MTVWYDVAELVEDFGLPTLPEPATTDESDNKILILFRRNAENVVLTLPVTFADADEYTNRPDTSGDGWFVGRDMPNDYEAGEIY